MEQRLPTENTGAEASVSSEVMRSTEATAPPMTEEARPRSEAEKAEVLRADISQAAMQRRQDLKRGFVGVLSVGAAGLVVRMVLKYLLGPERVRAFVTNPYWILANLLIVVAIGCLIVFVVGKRRRAARKATGELAGIDDVRSVGALVDALSLDDPHTHETAVQALTRLLPQLKASDAALLTPEQRDKLCRVLYIPIENVLFKDVTGIFKPAKNPAVDFRVAILQAFAQVGDSRALPIVTHLAEGEAKTAAERRIQAAALWCLPNLRARVEAELAPNTLLRASDGSGSDAQDLLRSVPNPHETKPD
jgi:hypothetical protein